MQIALTKKLADALELKLAASDESINPLFSWTVNWTKVWSNRRSEDMIVLVNNANRFTVAIYQVKKKDLKNLKVIIKTAIANTLLFMNVNPEIVNEYLRLAGEFVFTQNRGRQTAAWITKAGIECSFYIGKEYNGIDKMFCDTVGAPMNHVYVNSSKNRDEGFFPDQAMFKALSELTGLPVFKYRAFELLVSLDLHIYKAMRRIIVPADLEFARLHKVLQTAFGWSDYHLYDFTITEGKGKKSVPVARIVPDEDDLAYDEQAIFMGKHTLSEFLPVHKQMIYTYDMGDCWRHKIELVQVLEDYDKESPYLLEASGQTPPEDVGGVGGFLSFLEIIQDPNNREYEEMKEWAGFWTPELREWDKRPRVLRW